MRSTLAVDSEHCSLVVWARQDAVFLEESDTEELLAALQAAFRVNGLRHASLRLGERPLPPSGSAEDDLGHNFPWAVPELVAGAVAQFIEPVPARRASNAA